MDGLQKDITGFYRKLKWLAIEWLTDSVTGMSGPVSNTKLRKWGYLKYKRRKQGWYE